MHGLKTRATQFARDHLYFVPHMEHQPASAKLDFRALFESVPGLYLVLDVDPKFTILAASDAYLAATMTRRDEIVGRGVFEVFPDNPNDPNANGERNVRASLKRVRRDRQPDPMPTQKYDIRRPESEGGGFEERYWSALNSPVLDEQGEICCILHRAEDVTELIRIRGDSAKHLLAAQVLRESESRLRDLANELNAAREVAEKQRAAAEAANRAKDQFLGMLSHELRTPLTPVLLTVSLLEQFDSLPPEVQEDLQTIRRNVELEARLIDDLLDLTRITRGKLRLRPEVIDAHPLIRNAVDLCCGDRLADVKLHLEAKEHHVRADPSRFQQIVWNVLNNAAKFTPPGDDISVRTINDDAGNLVIEVQDAGVGIDPNILPSVFNAFQQGDASLTRKFGGLGLGLTITRALVEAHSGSISAASSGVGHGATFTISFPTTSAKPEPTAPHEPRAATSMRILLVEDHPGTLAAMTKLLTEMGHSVITAKTVKEALAAAEHEPIDLVVSDLGLPDGSGHDVMRALRHRYNLKGIAVSGFGMDEDLRKSEESGFERHLVKPIDLQKLQTAIEQAAS
jgi:signal transduction histidine kinase/CheY-like chemotaxis protein